MHFLSIWSLVGTIALWAIASADDDTIELISGTCVILLTRVYTWGDCPGYPPDCICADPNFLPTAVGCVDTLLKDVDPSELNEKRALALNGLLETCPNTTIAVLEDYSAAVSTLPPLGCVSDINTVCNVTRAFIPTETEVHEAFLAYKWSYVDSYLVCWRYGAATLAYWGGVILIRALIFWGLKLFPETSQRIGKLPVVKLTRRHFTLPALLTRYHSQPYSIFKFFTLNLPTREQSVILTLFLGLCIGLTFGYRMVEPNFIFFYAHSKSYSYYIGLISGYFILFHLPLLILFAGRNNILLFFTGWSHDTFVVFHKWIARIIMFETVIHTIALTIYEAVYDSFLLAWDSAYWNWGVVALVAGCLIIVQAMHVFRKAAYETFLVIHIISAVFFIVGSYYHIELLEGRVQFIWATAAVWSFERAVRIARVLLSNPFATALIESHNNTVLEFTITYSKAWKPDAGQHVFVHLLIPSCFWQSHPFSVIAPAKEAESGSFKLFVRAKDGMTRKVLKKAIAKGGTFSAHVWIDGPYGEGHNLENYSEALFIAGGSGITAVFAYIQKLIHTNSQTRISLYWSVSDDTSLTWFKHQIKYMAANNVNVQIHVTSASSSHITDDSFIAAVETASTISATSSNERSEPCSSGLVKSELVVNGATVPDKESLSHPHVSYQRLAVESTIREHIQNSEGSLVVLSCGPGSMNDAARNAVLSGLTATDNFVEYVEESYSW